MDELGREGGEGKEEGEGEEEGEWVCEREILMYTFKSTLIGILRRMLD